MTDKMWQMSITDFPKQYLQQRHLADQLCQNIFSSHLD